MASLVSHWWALVDVIGCNLHNRCDSRTFDRTKLNMFNLCDPGRNRCRMYGCTCSCSCMFVYTVRSSRRSIAPWLTVCVCVCVCDLFCGNVQRFGACSEKDATDALLKCIYDTDDVTSALLDTSISQHISAAARKRQVLDTYFTALIYHGHVCYEGRRYSEKLSSKRHLCRFCFTCRT